MIDILTTETGEPSAEAAVLLAIGLLALLGFWDYIIQRKKRRARK